MQSSLYGKDGEGFAEEVTQKGLTREIGALAESDHVSTDGETQHVHTRPRGPEKAELRVHGDV